jgi:PRC-barrel domain
MAWRGRQVLDVTGHPLGRVADIYLDRRLEQPTWVLVDLGSRSAFAPLRNAVAAGQAIRLQVDAATVHKAPTAPTARELSAPTEAMLRRYYEERGPRYAWEIPPPA